MFVLLNNVDGDQHPHSTISTDGDCWCWIKAVGRPAVHISRPGTKSHLSVLFLNMTRSWLCIVWLSPSNDVVMAEPIDHTKWPFFWSRTNQQVALWFARHINAKRKERLRLKEFRQQQNGWQVKARSSVVWPGGGSDMQLASGDTSVFFVYRKMAGEIAVQHGVQFTTKNFDVRYYCLSWNYFKSKKGKVIHPQNARWDLQLCHYALELFRRLKYWNVCHFFFVFFLNCSLGFCLCASHFFLFFSLLRHSWSFPPEYFVAFRKQRICYIVLSFWVSFLLMNPRGKRY